MQHSHSSLSTIKNWSILLYLAPVGSRRRSPAPLLLRGDGAMPVTSSLFSRRKGAASPQSILAQVCIPTEHGPRIFASGGRSSLEEVVLEAPWKRLATLGPCYGTPSSFIHSDCLSFFLSFFLVLKMPLNRGVGPRPRGRGARTRKSTSKGD